MTEREQEVLRLLREDPMIPQQELAERLGISRSALASHISSLMRQGYVLGRGYVLSEGPYAVVIGGANMDICGKAYGPLRLGDSNPGHVHTAAGGVGRNIAENLARLGSDTRLITAVGNDQHGQRLIELSQQAGINMRHTLVLDGFNTSCYLSLHDPHGEMSCAINDMAILEELNPQRMTQFDGLLSAASALVVDTNLSSALLAWIFGRYPQLAIFVDTVSVAKVDKIRPWLSAIHTIKPNRHEAEHLSGIPIEGPDSWSRVADWFLAAGIQRLFLSLGAEGIYYCDAEHRAHLPILPCPVINVTGGGDAYMGALIHAWLQHYPLDQAAHFARACAALAVGCEDTVYSGLSQAAVERMLEEYPC